MMWHSNDQLENAEALLTAAYEGSGNLNVLVNISRRLCQRVRILCGRGETRHESCIHASCQWVTHCHTLSSLHIHGNASGFAGLYVL